MRSRKLIFLFSFIFLLSCAPKAFASELDVSVVENNLRINSCSSQLQSTMGYKGYVNDVEIFTTGRFGGFPCYSGDVFISNLASFVSSYPAPLILRFDFYSDLGFAPPAYASFTVYYDGSEFTLTPPAPPASPSCSDGIQNQDEIGIDVGGVCEVVTPAPPACVTDCFSNVLFLPGMMGSKLYGADDEELWVSTNDSNHSDLALDGQGKSIDSAVYTKDETGVIDEIFGLNIYKSFIGDLEDWKEEGTIADYAFVPYDWRLSLDDIITNGAVNNGNLSYNIAQDFSESFLLKKLETLQENSKSGKVTIIAHSNGGLVAKALVQKLKDTNNPLYEKIDKIILVAVPQVGTPDAVAALLHGTELGYGFIMAKDRSRRLSENMSTVYNLLPSESYFTTILPDFAVDKIVSFENTPFFNPQTSQYGVFVSNQTELRDYILGTDGRSKPSFSDTVNPNIGNSALYEEAETIHEMLDVWEPSPETKVIQVAGWGEETIAGLDYKTYRDVAEHLSYKPRFVVDGDGTVVTPSALWMSDSNPNVERWWVDLKSYNERVVVPRNHRDILEVSNFRDFINSQIIDSSFNDEENIIVNDTSTLTSDKARLHFILHSPLTLGITDAEGNYTGMDPVTKEIKEEIPDVDYRQIGEVQFISAPAGTPYTLKLQGYDEGYFSLDVEEQTGNTITDSTLFEGIASSVSTFAIMEVASDFEVETSQLKVDENGDGNVDEVYPILATEPPAPEAPPAGTSSNNSSGSSGVASQSTAEQVVQEERKETQEETKSLDIAKAPNNIIQEPQAEKQADTEAETPEDIGQTEDTSLSASVVSSGFSGNWVWYVIILGILIILFLVRIFIKI
jgi:pimeloyl-ACP methyl ester carboxylesterase